MGQLAKKYGISKHRVWEIKELVKGKTPYKFGGAKKLNRQPEHHSPSQLPIRESIIENNYINKILFNDRTFKMGLFVLTMLSIFGLSFLFSSVDVYETNLLLSFVVPILLAAIVWMNREKIRKQFGR